MAQTIKAAIYARVSTERDQDPASQIEELRRYCVARGWAVTEEAVDHGFSGSTGQRPALKRLLGLVRARQVDAVVVVKLDRLARSVRHLVVLLDEFAALGVAFVSVRDQIDLTTASGRLMLHIVGAFAEFERALIRERTLAGLDHARRKGKRLGRPPAHDTAAIQALRAHGLSYRAISRSLSVPLGSVHRALLGVPKSPLRQGEKTPTVPEGNHA